MREDASIVRYRSGRLISRIDARQWAAEAQCDFRTSLPSGELTRLSGNPPASNPSQQKDPRGQQQGGEVTFHI